MKTRITVTLSYEREFDPEWYDANADGSLMTEAQIIAHATERYKEETYLFTEDEWGTENIVALKIEKVEETAAAPEAA